MRLSRQEGQNIVLFAVVLIALLAIATLVLDGGMALSYRRKMQNAADAGALAGVWELTQNSTDNQVYSRIQDYTVTYNGATIFAATYEPSGTPVGSGSIPNGTDGVIVEVEFTYDTFFATIIGINQITVRASASAGSTAGPLDALCAGNYVIWADSTTCDKTIHWSGGNMVITGSVHSNHEFKMSGGDNTITGATEYVTSINVSGSGNTYTPTLTSVAPMPVSFDRATYEATAQAGTRYTGDYAISGANQTLNGPMYIDGKFTISGQDATLNGLFYVTGKVSFSGGVSAAISPS